MECNKDEALRSKGIAEAKFSQHDYVGAKKFAQKAKQLFPELEGIPQLISALDIHILAEEKLYGGEANWYAILQVDPAADDNTIRKQYRKLALLLHPDKNKSVGAEAAFKLISEAWAILSDKAKKASYDIKYKGKILSRVTSHPKDPPTTTTTTATGPDCSYSANMAKAPPPQPFKRTAPSQPPRRAQTQRPPPHKANIPRALTFWTACPSCKMELEYQRVYLNKALCCPVCYKPFMGKEVVPVGGTILWPPSHAGMGPQYDGIYLKATLGRASLGNFHSAHVQNNMKPPVESTGAIPIRKDDAGFRGVMPDIPQGIKEEIPSGFQERGLKNQKHPEPRGSKEKTPIEEVEAGKDVGAKEAFRARFKGEGLGESAEKAKKKKTNSVDVKPVEEQKMKDKEAADKKEALNRLIVKSKADIELRLSLEKEKKVTEDRKFHTMTENSGIASMNATVSHKMSRFNNGNIDSRGHINSKGKVECSIMTHRKRTNSKRDDPTLDHVNPEKKVKEEDKLEHILGRGDDEPPTKNNASSSEDVHEEIPSFKQSMPAFFVDLRSNAMATAVDGEDGEDALMIVPDAEFYDFDKDRSEGHFSAGQIWAAYDDADGMPRYYAKVNKVFSSHPFKVQMTWLESRPFGGKKSACTDSGLSIACGDFKLGEVHISDQINTYSHMMTAQGQRGGFKIYPRKGDIWALYKELDCLKVKEKKTDYSVVEILTDFNDKEGGEVWKLIKVEGFKTLFRRQPGKAYMELISGIELRRFSHRIPAYCLSADEGPRALGDCWELDPAATPPELVAGT